jgi:hypothetical protein
MNDESGEVVFEPIAVDTDAAARLLGLSPSTVRAYMRRGDLLPRYSGRKPIFTIDELRKFVGTLPDEPTRF